MEFDLLHIFSKIKQQDNIKEILQKQDCWLHLCHKATLMK